MHFPSNLNELGWRSSAQISISVTQIHTNSTPNIGKWKFWKRPFFFTMRGQRKFHQSPRHFFFFFFTLLLNQYKLTRWLRTKNIDTIKIWISNELAKCTFILIPVIPAVISKRVLTGNVAIFNRLPRNISWRICKLFFKSQWYSSLFMYFAFFSETINV